MSIGIVDIGIGNLGSLNNALRSQGWDSVYVTKPEDLFGLTHLLLPGVGSFYTAANLLLNTGLFTAIQNFATHGHPVMGICLGMQLLGDHGAEGGGMKGMGLISGEVVTMKAPEGLRIPHIGWNSVQQIQSHPLFEGIRNNIDFYFVHSYQFIATNNKVILATTEYGEKFTSVIACNNVVGVQFHPEKSQLNGLRLLDNFCCWSGKC